MLCWCTLLYEEVVFVFCIFLLGLLCCAFSFLLFRGFELGLLFVLRYSVLRDTLVDSSRDICIQPMYKEFHSIVFLHTLGMISQIGSLRSE